jgi:O-antigen/teichoic acid export membrane protein
VDVETESRNPIPLGRLRASVGWGLVDQVLSSGTNLGLVVLGGRLLGPARLGVISVGFAAYVLILVLHRALVPEPLIVAGASSGKHQWRGMGERGLFASLLLGTTAAAVMGIVGLVAGGPFGRGLLLFAPWILPALVQDFWRFLLFRDGKGASAAANDGAWVVGMGLSTLVTVWFRSDWVVVSAWGMGALCGAGLGFIQTRLGLRRPSLVWRWWRSEVWPLGRWLSIDRVIATAGSQGAILLIAGLAAASDVGGLRAVQSVFAPLSLLGPAIGLPGLPALSSALNSSPARARWLAMRLSGALVGMALVYLLMVGAFGGALLSALFGPAFRSYRNLIYPIATAQLLIAVGVGFILLLKAARRGRSLLVNDLAGASVLLLAVWLLTQMHGVEGAAWALAVGAGFTTALMVLSGALLSVPVAQTPAMSGPAAARASATGQSESAS